MDEGYRCTGDDATGGWRDDAHTEDENGEIAAEFVFPQRDKSDQSGTGVDEDGREQCPKEDMVPHFPERVEGRGLGESNHILDRVEVNAVYVTGSSRIC